RPAPGHRLCLIPALPFLGAVLIAFLGPRLLRDNSHWPCIIGIAVAFVVSAVVFVHVYSAEGEAPTFRTEYYSWIKAGSVDVGLSFRADALTAMMLVMITFIATLIAIYSTGYMHHDPGYPRFFAAIALFVPAFTTLRVGEPLIV